MLLKYKTTSILKFIYGIVGVWYSMIYNSIVQKCNNIIYINTLTSTLDLLFI